MFSFQFTWTQYHSTSFFFHFHLFTCTSLYLCVWMYEKLTCTHNLCFFPSFFVFRVWMNFKLENDKTKKAELFILIQHLCEKSWSEKWNINHLIILDIHPWAHTINFQKNSKSAKIMKINLLQFEFILWVQIFIHYYHNREIMNYTSWEK